MTVELTFDSTYTEPFPFEQRHDRPDRRPDSRSPCYVAGSRSHRRCSERAIVKTGPHQVFWNHSHCTPDNTANIKTWPDILLEPSKRCPGEGGTLSVLNKHVKHYCITLLIRHIFNYNYTPLLQKQGTAVAQWLRCSATNRKFAG